MLFRSHLDWLLVTKRIGNVRQMIPDRWSVCMPPNLWLGITVVNQAEADRDIPKLLGLKVSVRFLSMEPLLGPVNLRHLNEDRETNEVDCLHPWTWEQEIDAWRDTDDEWEDQFKDYHGVAVSDASGPMHASVDWVIVGGESGPGARPCNVERIRDVVKQCAAAKVPCFVKQLGANPHTFCESTSEVTVDLRLRQLRLKHPKGGDPAEWPEDLRVRQFPEVVR